MPEYGFRVRFLLEEGYVIGHDGDSLDIPLPSGQKKVILRPVSGAKIRESSNLTLRANGFSSADEAHAYGQRIKNALKLCGLLIHVGIDVGKDTATSGAGKMVKDTMKAAGIKLLDDVHGLIVYPEDLPIRFASIRGELTVEKSSTTFIEALTKAYEIVFTLTDKQSLALELYNISRFESLHRARFLTLVTAVECLGSRAKQPEHIISYIDVLIEQTKGSLLDTEREHLVPRLRELKTESISRSCRNLVNEYLGQEAMKFFSTCYNIRSKLVHEGSTPKDTRLARDVLKLDELVSQLLLATITNSRAS